MATQVETSPRTEPRACEGPHAMNKARLFLRLFLQNQRRIYAYVLTLLPNRADADDVFQEASLVLWDKFDESSPPDDFAAWGCRIAYFKVLDFYKNSDTLIRAKTRIAGLTLRATDTDWTHGEGPVVEGRLLDLLMAATGREAALDNLAGNGVTTFRQHWTHLR